MEETPLQEGTLAVCMFKVRKLQLSVVETVFTVLNLLWYYFQIPLHAISIVLHFKRQYFTFHYIYLTATSNSSFKI